MWLKTLNRGSPEQVFVAVLNADTAKMTVGHAAMWRFQAGGTGSGYDVVFPRNTADENQGLFAGIVAGTDIPANDYGSIQVYGYHTGVRVYGGTANGLLNGIAATNAYNATSLTDRMFRPYNCFTTETGVTGYLGVIEYGAMTTTNSGATLGTALRLNWPGPYCIPVDSAGATFTPTATWTGTVPAFIKCI